MSKTYEITIDRFDGGMSDDPRLQVSNQGRLLKHWDIHYSPKMLKPNRSFVNDMNDGSTSTGMKQYGITEFLWDSANQRVWGVGHKADGTGIKISYKGLTDASWTVIGNTTDSSEGFSGVAATDVWTTLSGTTSEKGIYNGSPLVSNQTANGLTNGVTYYAGNVTSTTFKLYTDAGLTSVLDLTVNGNYFFSITADLSSAPGYYFPGSAVIDITTGRIYAIVNNAGTIELVYYSIGPGGYTTVTAGLGSMGALAAGTTYTVARPLRAADDNIYFPLRGGTYPLFRLDPTGTPTTSDVSAIVPTGFVVTSLTPYGLYMAIALNRLYGGSDSFPDIVSSRVHIYDLINLDPLQVIDWGRGSLKILGNLGGTLVGITDEYVSNTLGNDTGKIVIKEWRGGSTSAAETLKELIASSTGTTFLPVYKGNESGKLSFYARIPFPGGAVEGIWSYGKKRAADDYAFSLRIETSAFATSAGAQSFFDIGNFTFISHSNDGSIVRTADAETYAYTSVYESQVFLRDYEQQLKSVELTTQPLPASSSAIVRYRVNGASSWTLLMTMNTTSATYDLRARPESGGEFLKHHEIEFRIESTGGAVPLRLRARYETRSSESDDG